jgi:hypothetical protein
VALEPGDDVNAGRPPNDAGREPLPAHSLAEAHFYLMAQSCGQCEQGRLLSATSHREESPRAGYALLTMQAKCSNCNAEFWYLFEFPDANAPAGESGTRINASAEPSRILDVTDWVTLHQIVLNAADRASDRTEARELRCDAGECLDEALRFFEAESELPPADALFSMDSRRRLKDRPELYIRQAIIEKRRKLPSRRPAIAASPRHGRRWWRFWR